MDTKERLATRLARINQERKEKEKELNKIIGFCFIFGLIVIIIEASI